MQITFGNNKKDGLDMFNNDKKIPVGPQLNKEGEFNPTGKAKLFVQISKYEITNLFHCFCQLSPTTSSDP